MALTLKSNANMDSVCAAVPGPYGPLTRVGDMADVDLNSGMPVEVTSALSVTLFISYDDIVDVTVRDKILAQAHSTNGKFHVGYLFHLLVQVMYNHFAVMDDAGWYTGIEWQKMVQMIRYFQPLTAMIPDIAFTEYDEEPVQAAFTYDDTLLVVDFTNTTTGEAEYYLWDFGDGSVSITAGFAPTPVQHTYAGAGSKTVRLIAVGSGGISVTAQTFTVSAT